MNKMNYKVLLIEPPGNFIRLDRCMQSINSWGGVYRFPLNLSRIGSHLLSLGFNVNFIDLQADPRAELKSTLISFKPDLCILSSGFPSMKLDSETAAYIKQSSPSTHVSTFGVAPTLLKEKFFDFSIWNFDINFDSIVVGGEPALGYEKLLEKGLPNKNVIIHSSLEKFKNINTTSSRILFNHSLYKSPFSGERSTYIEGTYGCPFDCSYCVVPRYYNKIFAQRTAKDIVNEFQYVIENDEVTQITLWDEGTTYQRRFINELCDGLIELRKSNINKFRNFIWTTRSTTALLDEEIIEKLAHSGLGGITLGIESFNEKILSTIEKEISLDSNLAAIKNLNKHNIVSIGHIILGHISDTKESIKETIFKAINSDLNFVQFYCAVPYPGTKLYSLAKKNNLIQVNDLTKYELSNAIMDTLGGVSYREVAKFRKEATDSFWTNARWEKLEKMANVKNGISVNKRNIFLNWNQESKLAKTEYLLAH